MLLRGTPDSLANLVRVKSWAGKAARGKEACENSLNYFSDFTQQEEAGEELNALNVITAYSAPDHCDLGKLESTYLITNTSWLAPFLAFRRQVIRVWM